MFCGLLRTGQGKTLAFVLPIVERLLTHNATDRAQRGRLPRVIVLAPTRELAKQVRSASPSTTPLVDGREPRQCRLACYPSLQTQR